MEMLACIARPATDTLSGRHDMALRCGECGTPVVVAEGGVLLTADEYLVEGVDQVVCLPANQLRVDYHTYAVKDQT